MVAERLVAECLVAECLVAERLVAECPGIVKVISKYKAREKDAEEHRMMEENHKKVMGKYNKDENELDKALYNKVLKRISDKGKRMFNLLNKSSAMRPPLSPSATLP